MASVGRATFLLYFLSTLFAVCEALVLAAALRPGKGAALGGGDHACSNQTTGHKRDGASLPEGLNPTSAFLDVLRKLVPDNIAEAAATDNILGVVAFTLAIGVALANGTPDQISQSQAAVTTANDAVTRLVRNLLWATPVGIASLIAAQIAAACQPLTMLSSLSRFILVYLTGLALHSCVVLPLMMTIATRNTCSPFRTMVGALPAVTTAFATDSSSASLPVMLECAETTLDIQPRIARFVIPLGSTVNMNGTALYEAMAVIFLAQAHGRELGISEMAIVAATASLAAVGAAAIPSAGLVTMVMVLEAVGMDEYINDLALLLACDWLLDRCRTAVNVLGDIFTCAIVDNLAKGSKQTALASTVQHLPSVELSENMTQLEHVH
eukprot:CAMPEP_0114311748 /NCGR_PEP_ID=MMETSP0059-20121206/20005_1 /TAXON_ID=36894 /ORGANISM="Pyramimonas parkeae, Strain CCMP726" /LENGTH=381 /DNA_ID=CAMNT_0001435973 /DNA_START=84 /DNA_END=1229 /DNA_ORIENTATION=-